MTDFRRKPGDNQSGRWISYEQILSLEESGTTAFRAHSAPDGWVECLGNDLLISYKTEEARARLAGEAAEWQIACSRCVDRLFAKLLPKQNAERVTPVLLSGDATLSLTTV